VRSKSRVSKFFVASGAGGVERGVLVCWLRRGGSAAAEAAMVERGGSVIDPRRLHVEKPTRGEMTFYFAEYQNCMNLQLKLHVPIIRFMATIQNIGSCPTTGILVVQSLGL